jgi:hypothetical protein
MRLQTIAPSSQSDYKLHISLKQRRVESNRRFLFPFLLSPLEEKKSKGKSYVIDMQCGVVPSLGMSNK